MVRGLQTMSDLLSLAGKEYAKTDQQSGEALNATMQGHGDGGGGAQSPGGGAVGAGGGPLPAPVSELASQMNLDQPSALGADSGSVVEQLGSGATQAGQLGSGFVQQAAQMAGGVAEQVTQMVEGLRSGEGTARPRGRRS